MTINQRGFGQRTMENRSEQNQKNACDVKRKKKQKVGCVADKVVCRAFALAHTFSLISRACLTENAQASNDRMKFRVRGSVPFVFSSVGELDRGKNILAFLRPYSFVSGLHGFCADVVGCYANMLRCYK